MQGSEAVVVVVGGGNDPVGTSRARRCANARGSGGKETDMDSSVLSRLTTLLVPLFLLVN